MIMPLGGMPRASVDAAGPERPPAIRRAHARPSVTTRRRSAARNKEEQ